MKLRIHGNSIRLRVSRSEIELIERRGWLEDVVRIAPGAELQFRLEITHDPELSAALRGSAIVVGLPERLARSWYENAEVSVRGAQAVPGSEALTLLIEKDFACLVPREGEDQSDQFTNPASQ